VAWTVWCIGLVLAAPVLLGAPVSWLLGGCRPLDRQGWARAPFLGLGATVLLLQNLVYLDWPVARTAWLPWLAAAVLWGAMALRGQLRAGLAAVPWGLYGLAAAAYLLQGVGLLLLGAEHYVGRAWSDQFNYTSLGEFFARWLFSTPAAVIGEAPWLTPAVRLKFDRIGQSVLHAFLMVSSGGDARALFGPTILLGPTLTVLAVAALAERLGVCGRRALLAAAAAGPLPAVAMLHLDCFLSHALAAPLLLLLPAWIDDLVRRPGPAALIRAVLLLNLMVAVYSEFLLLAAGLLALQLALALLCRRLSWRLAACLAALAVSPWLVNRYYAIRSLLLVGARVHEPVLAGVYPWALTVAGWGRAWLGDLAGATASTTETLVRLLTLAVTGLGYLGLARGWRASWPGTWAGRREPAAFAGLSVTSAVLALALLPVLVVLKDDRLAYQTYKLLLTVAPVLVVGLVAAPAKPQAAGIGGLVPLVLVLGLGAAGTVQMAFRSGVAYPELRSLAHRLLAPDVRRLRRALEGSSGGDLVIAHPDGFERSWLAYFGRRHRVRLAFSTLIDLDLATIPEAAPALRLDGLSGDLLLVTPHQPPFRRVSPGELELVFAGESCRLWRGASPRWAVPLGVANPNGLERLGGQPFFWVGGPATRLDVLAGAPGRLTLQATALPGPSLPTTRQRRLLVRAPGGYEAEWRTEGGPLAVEVPVGPGRSTVWLECPDRPAPGTTANGDPRPLLVGLQGLEVSFTPAEGDPVGSPGARPGGEQR
jgi:hypothetical protein